ncbi:hypothetical protein [Terriglobus tenax]|uniref:hypothetical protein n=1 Tax=Terriglobus tenax TaxID=1111115 RepID=UPI0021E03056|nr:hypothetical protein [Terriglobus tenax]
MNIDDSFFYFQNQRFHEARDWFNKLYDLLLNHTKRFSGHLESYTGQTPELGGQYGVDVKEDGIRTVRFTNGTAAIELKMNDPVGWVTLKTTKHHAFYASVILGGFTPKFNDYNSFVFTGVGCLANCKNLSDVQDVLIDHLYNSDLSEEDCNISLETHSG